MVGPQPFQNPKNEQQRNLNSGYAHLFGNFVHIANDLRAHPEVMKILELEFCAQVESLISKVEHPVVCSYLACLDDAEIPMDTLHEVLLQQYGSFVLPTLVDGKLRYMNIIDHDFQEHVTDSAELKINQVTKGYPEVEPDSITHMLIPGLSIVDTHDIHTGWVFSRHSTGYDSIIDYMRKNKFQTKFIGIVPQIFKVNWYQELLKHKVDVIVSGMGTIPIIAE
jgi:hypothetical protein